MYKVIFLSLSVCMCWLMLSSLCISPSFPLSLCACIYVNALMRHFHVLVEAKGRSLRLIHFVKMGLRAWLWGVILSTLMEDERPYPYEEHYSVGTGSQTI